MDHVTGAPVLGPSILPTSLDHARLEAMPVSEYMDLFAL